MQLTYSLIFSDDFVLFQNMATFSDLQMFNMSPVIPRYGLWYVTFRYCTVLNEYITLGAEEIQTIIKYPKSLHCVIGHTVAIEPPLAQEVNL